MIQTTIDILVLRISTAIRVLIYLLLSQDEHPVWFDGVIWCQIFTAAPHHAILEGLPHPISGGPRDAQVVPFAVINEERQLCNLQHIQVDLNLHLERSVCNLKTVLPVLLNNNQCLLSFSPSYHLPGLDQGSYMLFIQMHLLTLCLIVSYNTDYTCRSQLRGCCTLSLMRISIGLLPHSISTISLA